MSQTPETPTVGWREMVDTTGATVRQFDHWTRRGWLHVVAGTTGSGRGRRWPVSERDVCARMVALINAGVATERARQAARGGLALQELAGAVRRVTGELGEYDDMWWAAPGHQEFINRILEQAPDSWDGEESAEWVAVEYVRELERRVLAAGGSLDKYQGEQD